MKRLSIEVFHWTALAIAAFWASWLGMAVVHSVVESGDKPVAMFYIPRGVLLIPIIIPLFGFLFYLVLAACVPGRTEEEFPGEFLLATHKLRGAGLCAAFAFILGFTPLSRLSLAESLRSIARFFYDTFHFWFS